MPDDIDLIDEAVALITDEHVAGQLQRTLELAAAQARGFHQLAAQAERQAAEYRAARDGMIRGLRAANRATWTYAAIAQEVGCSPELVARICSRPARQQREEQGPEGA